MPTLNLRVNSDPVMRTIICRVPFSDISPESLYRATKLPVPRIMQALKELQGMGLVIFDRNLNGRLVIAPASRYARSKMRRWSYDWCGGGDECGVTR